MKIMHKYCENKRHKEKTNKQTSKQKKQNKNNHGFLITYVTWLMFATAAKSNVRKKIVSLDQAV